MKIDARRFFFSPRILRAQQSDCWGDELGTALTTYTDDFLSGLRQTGFDAIWVRVYLMEMAATRLFPAVPKDKLKMLDRLANRAARHGIKIYVYLNEPRALRAEDPFWKRHPDLKGMPGTFANLHSSIDGLYHRLCTSHPAVKEHLEEGAYQLFRQTPGLGGAFLINASENFTHCYSHYYPKPTREHTPLSVNWLFHAPVEVMDQALKLTADYRTQWARGMTCPRCIQREPVEVTAEVIERLTRGIKKAAPRADVIVWTWSWSLVESDPQRELIRRLPKGIILMSDWERGGAKKILGRNYYVDEYSFSSIGPSTRFLAQLRLARRRGLKMMAKIQIGSTHEFAATPYLPLPSLLAEKMARLRRYGAHGYLGCWNFGGDITPMSILAGRMSRAPALAPKAALRWLARTAYGVRQAAPLIAAWNHFGRGWREYPFAMPFIYNGPMGYAPAFPFALHPQRKPIPANWFPLPRDKQGHLMVGFEGAKWLRMSNTESRYQTFAAHEPAPFNAAIAAGALDAMLREWTLGLRCYRQALAGNPGNESLTSEYRLAEHIGLCLQSTVHIIRFYTALETLASTRDRRQRALIRARLCRILTVELKNVGADRELIIQDDRLGFHPEAHRRMFTPEDLDWKIKKLKRAIRILNQDA